MAASSPCVPGSVRPGLLKLHPPQMMSTDQRLRTHRLFSSWSTSVDAPNQGQAVTFKFIFSLWHHDHSGTGLFCWLVVFSLKEKEASVFASIGSVRFLPLNPETVRHQKKQIEKLMSKQSPYYDHPRQLAIERWVSCLSTTARGWGSLFGRKYRCCSQNVLWFWLVFK